MRIVEVTQPVFEYLIKDPTKIRYNSKIEGEVNDIWRGIIVQTYNPNHGLPEPKEGEILFKYTYNRGYLLKV